MLAAINSIKEWLTMFVTEIFASQFEKNYDQLPIFAKTWKARILSLTIDNLVNISFVVLELFVYYPRVIRGIKLKVPLRFAMTDFDLI